MRLDTEQALSILDMLREGLRYREIAAKVHYSIPQICIYRKLFVAAGMLPAKRLTKRQRIVKERLEQGDSCAEIAKELKVSIGTVYRDRKILAQHGCHI